MNGFREIVVMDTDILIENKDCFYGDDFLDELTKDYQWSSLLDATDASPSEILADAAPILVPPISPVLSIKSSPTESSNSDSGSEDDSKNSSNSTSDRLSSQSPFDWLSSFDDEPTNNLNLEDVEQFLQKTEPVINTPDRNGPIMAIENGVIKEVGMDRDNKNKIFKLVNPLQPKQNGNSPQNSYFNMVNENNITNNSLIKDNEIILNDQIRLVVEQKKIPSILKRPVVPTSALNANGVVIPDGSTKGGRIAISPLSYTVNGGKDSGMQIKLSPPRNSMIINTKLVGANVTDPVQNIVIPTVEVDSNPQSPSALGIDVTHLSDADIRAMKKLQRMIKNRESACQSRQKKKEYVTALEQQLLEAHQEIGRLRLENKLLRDKLDNGKSRKIPRLDTSLLIPKKNIAVLFAMVLMVSLNFNILGWNNKPLVGPSAPHGSSRHLLWSEDSSSEAISDYDQAVNRSTLGINCNSTKGNESYMNQTESTRIVGELNRWIGGANTLNWTYDVPRKKRKVYNMNEETINGGLLETYKILNKMNIDNNLVDFPTTTNRKNLKGKTRLRRLRRNKDIEFPENSVLDYELYHEPIRTPVNDFDIDFGEWNALLQALQRRDDTFYVVGVGKGEHLLLPAVSHNNTRPPKMVLILPAKSGNDSVMSDHVTLMQIDCSIVNTTLVKLKSDKLPESLRLKSSEIKSELEQKKTTYLRRPKPIDDPLDVLKNTNNVSNYPLKHKGTPQLNDISVGKGDLFTQYLITKYAKSKNDSVSSVKNYSAKNKSSIHKDRSKGSK